MGTTLGKRWWKGVKVSLQSLVVLAGSWGIVTAILKVPLDALAGTDNFLLGILVIIVVSLFTLLLPPLIAYWLAEKVGLMRNEDEPHELR